MGFSRITNHPDGVTTGTEEFFRKFPYPNPFLFNGIQDDFVRYSASDWMVTETQVGIPTYIILDQRNGVLEVVNSGADDDLVSHQLPGETFQFVSNKRLLFTMQVALNDWVESEWFFGLCPTSVDPFAETDICAFIKPDGVNAIEFQSLDNGVGELVSNVATPGVGESVTLGFYFDGVDGYLYVDNKTYKILSTLVVPDEELTLTFALRNGEAAVKSYTTDFIFAYQER
jgi:hypothetical protein